MEKNSLKNQRRKKIWQVETGYHCPIVGTCLGRADLRRLKRKKIFGLPASASDYEVHNAFAGIGGNKTAQARALQKVLDEKYASSVKNYAGLYTDEELWENWQKDSQGNQAPGAFWAIMTHGAASAELLARVYGECHMISFDIFSQQRNSSAVVRRTEEKFLREEKKVIALKEKLKRQQEKTAQLQKALREEKSAVQKMKVSAAALNKEKDRLAGLLSERTWDKELEELRSIRCTLEQENERLQEALSVARQDVCEFRAKANSARIQKERLAVSLSEMTPLHEGCFQQDSCADQQGSCADQQDSCADHCECCEDYGTDACVGPDLCGKMILYVGGRSNMVPLYKQLVEGRGGRFSHHDGGRENSRQQLPRLLSGADVVLCPVDCVSHDACKQVKRICKRYCKPFVMMRSSGVSALEKELDSVM